MSGTENFEDLVRWKDSGNITMDLIKQTGFRGKRGKKIKMSLCLIKYHTMNMYVEVQLHTFLNSVLHTGGQLYDLAALSLVPTGEENGWALGPV